MHLQYAVIIEKGPTSYGAYVPDLPGCVAAGETRDEVVRLIRETIEFHLEGLREGPPRTPDLKQRISESEVNAADGFARVPFQDAFLKRSRSQRFTKVSGRRP